MIVVIVNTNTTLHGCHTGTPLAVNTLVLQSVFTITEKAPTKAFSWLKAP